MVIGNIKDKRVIEIPVVNRNAAGNPVNVRLLCGQIIAYLENPDNANQVILVTAQEQSSIVDLDLATFEGLIF